MKAYLKNYRQSPRKVRSVADLIRGKSVTRAYMLLDETSKRATDQLRKLVASAVANAKQGGGVNEDSLVIKSLRVDEGPTLKRMRPRARGSAFLIRKRTSNVMIELAKKGGTTPELQKKDDDVSKITKK